MKVLITGFEPFGGEKINPSYEAIKELNDKILEVDIIKEMIPTVFKKSINVLENIIKKEMPDIVICVGQAGGRDSISIERVAINLDDARISDNEENKPIDEKIKFDGDNAYFSNLPIKLMAKYIRKKGIKAEISNTAGTFVCNHLMYGLLYLIEKKYPNIRGGFIHVPYIKEQVKEKIDVPYMDKEEITIGLKEAIKVCIKNITDIKVSEGKIY